MIILNDNRNVNIPDYNDLINKPSINGVMLEGDVSAAELGIVVDTTNFYTKNQSDNKFQPKGNYLTSIPSNYVTDSELQEKNYATKNEIPVVPTNISSFTNDSGYITNNALSNYVTISYVEDNYQPKGNYLTEIPSEYVTEEELNNAIAGLGGSESVAYLIIKDNLNNTFSYVGGSFEDVVNAYNNNQPYFIYVPNGAGTNYYSLAETTIITDTYIQCLSFAHTGVTHTWRYWRLYPTSITLYSEMTYEYATKSQLDKKQDTLVSGTNIKTINGQTILGSGNIVIEGGSGGSTDLTGYATETWVGNHYQTKGDYATTSYVDTQIGNINTILENIIG